MKDEKINLRGLHVSDTWVDRGTGTPKNRDEFNNFNRQDVCETSLTTLIDKMFPHNSCEENSVWRKWNSPLFVYGT